MTYGLPSSVTQRHRYPNKMVILPLPPSAQRQGGYVLTTVCMGPGQRWYHYNTCCFICYSLLCYVLLFISHHYQCMLGAWLEVVSLHTHAPVVSYALLFELQLTRVTTTGALTLCMWWVGLYVLDSSVGSDSQSMLTMFYMVVSAVSVMTVNGATPPPCLTYGTASCVSHAHIAHIHVHVNVVCICYRKSYIYDLFKLLMLCMQTRSVIDWKYLVIYN